MTLPGHGTIALAILLLGACTRAPEPAAPPHVDEAADQHADEDEALLHLSDDMLRDFRIGTAIVAERVGAQEVDVLGEVAVDPDHYAEVSPPSAGQVVEIAVAQNAHVRRGDLLARLRSSELGRARADLLAARARLNLAQQTLDRKATLAAERIVAARELQEAQAAAEAARADVDAMLASIRAMGVDEGDAAGEGAVFPVRSPIDGQVIDRKAVIGRHADPAAPLFVVANLARVSVVVQAFERDAVNVRPGNVAHIVLAARPGQEVDGRVTQVGQQVEPGSRTLAIRIAVPNRDGLLRPGMSASVRLELGQAGRTVIAVPAAALQRVGDRWLAFVPRNDHEFEMRAVGRGRDLGNDVEIVSGLRPGETVVVEGAFLLKAEAEKRSGGGAEHAH